MNIAILIPCYNEASTIAQVIRDFRNVLPEASIYVYDNNSTDDTAKIALEAGAIVRPEPKQGKGNVVRRMFREIEADCYLMVDGDNTYNPADAPVIIQKLIDTDADMVVGDRLSTTYFQENKRPFHNSGNKLVRGIIRHFWKADIHDIMSGYRAFSRRFVKMMPVMSENFEIETELTIHALDKRFVVEEVATEYKDRPSGSFSKLNTFKDGWKVLKTIFTLFKEYRPLAFFGYTALFLLILAVIFFIPVLSDYIHTGLVPRFPTLFVSLFLGLSAELSFFTGVFLDVMVTKDRKNYELKLNQYNNAPLI